MKKQLILLTVIFSLLFSNVFSQSVYVTKTGKKYHKETCKYLSQSSIAINLSDALAKGYEPCSVCKPSTTVTTTPTNQREQEQTQKSEPKNYKQSSNQEVQSVQCSATTKAGARCKRMTKSANGKCWQHGGN